MNDSKVYTRKELNQLLYRVALRIVGGQTDDEGEAVRLVRSRLCTEATRLSRGKTRTCDNYKELKEQELVIAIGLGEDEAQVKGKPATKKQLGILASLSIKTALHETDMSDYFYETSHGTLGGEELLDHMRWVNQTTKKLPPEIFHELCKRWINPTLNKWLEDAGMVPRKANNPTMFFMRDLSTTQASHLIGRMRRAFDERMRKSPHVHVPTTN